MMNDMATLSVVAAEPTDLPVLTRMKPGYNEKNVAERFQWLEQDVDRTWLLLKDSEGCIGWCVVVWSGKRTHPEYPDIQDLLIRPEHRNKGYGTYLIRQVEHMAKKKDHSMIGLAVNPDHNPSARRLYERLGYQHDGGEKYLDGIYGDFEDWVIDLEKSICHFPLVDQYMAIRMDLDFAALKPGRVTVVESPRRLRREQSYGFVHALWWVWLEDGRSAASVPPGAGKAVGKISEDIREGERLFDPDLAEQLKIPVNEALRKAGLKETDRVLCSLSFACNASLLRRHRHGDCWHLVDESVPPAEGLGLPTHCFPDGIVYGVLADGMIVSVAFAHRSGVMEGQVADLGVEAAPAYRRRGYAKTVVSAVVEHITRAGGEARYGCSPDNQASIATARSVGFVPYGTSLVLSAPRPDWEPE